MDLLALVDCENFYASCERIFRPDLKKVPIVVLSNNDGCVIARSKESKDFGIQMGAPWFKVKEDFLKSGGQVFSSNFALYGDISSRVMSVLSQMSKKIEIYSIDEAFLDLENLALESHDAANNFGVYCRNIVKQWVGIPVRIGIAPTKTLTKVASYLAKQQTHHPGIFSITNNQKDIETALKRVPIHQVWGVGRRLNKKLSDSGMKNAYDLACSNIPLIRKKYSVVLERTVRELRGERCLAMDENPAPKKQIVVSRSFANKISDLNTLSPIVNDFGVRACEKLRKEGQLCSKVGVFIRTSPFRTQDRQHQTIKFYTLHQPSDDTRDILSGIRWILPKIFRHGFCYAKAGVMLSQFTDENVLQYELFEQINGARRNNQLMKTLDKINHSSTQVNFASQSKIGFTAMRRANVSPRYTTSWFELPTVN